MAYDFTSGLDSDALGGGVNFFAGVNDAAMKGYAQAQALEDNLYRRQVEDYKNQSDLVAGRAKDQKNTLEDSASAFRSALDNQNMQMQVACMRPENMNNPACIAYRNATRGGAPYGMPGSPATQGQPAATTDPRFALGVQDYSLSPSTNQPAQPQAVNYGFSGMSLNARATPAEQQFGVDPALYNLYQGQGGF